jgi:3-phosphoshikimate 1-carboxyvinyltransferase
VSAVCNRKGPLRGAIAVPGDKSISHRALILGALSTGETRIRGLLEAEDVSATRRAAERLGARIAPGVKGELVVTPTRTPVEPDQVIDCGNSGTSLRLLCGVLSALPGLSVLTGDDSLRRRPVRRVVEPLRRMGAQIWARSGDTLPPVVIRGGALKGQRHQLEVASAQVKSALLLAGLFAQGETVVAEPSPSRDHTERLLTLLGVGVRSAGPTEVHLSPGLPRGGTIEVPGDLSSAAFFLTGAAMVPGSAVTVREVGLNPTRTGLLEVLRAMGAAVEVKGGDGPGEPRGEITVRHAELRGTEIGGALIPRLIDELPILMVAATQARGKTVIRDARELRVKESDRLATMGEALRSAGARIELSDDGCAIEGPTPLRGVPVTTRMDHRVAMSMAIAQLCAQGPMVLDDDRFVATSFPSFFGLLDRLCGGA